MKAAGFFIQKRHNSAMKKFLPLVLSPALLAACAPTPQAPEYVQTGIFQSSCDEVLAEVARKAPSLRPAPAELWGKYVVVGRTPDRVALQADHMLESLRVTSVWTCTDQGHQVELKMASRGQGPEAAAYSFRAVYNALPFIR